MYHMSMERQPDRRRRQAQATNGLVASQAKTNVLPCQQDDDSQGGERDIQIPNLPEDIWCHIHSLMPMRDAARAACVSHAFLRSWRCHPNLIFCGTILGMKKKAYGNDDEIARDFCSKVDHILKKHSGIGVKKLVIDMCGCYAANDSCYINSWLLTAVTPGIEELLLALPVGATYKFPCSLLSNGRDSIRYLLLSGCSLQPTAELPWLKRLTKVELHALCFTKDELGCLLCNSFALERLVIRHCDEIDCLKIPCVLQQLRYLDVICCDDLQVIDNKAPNISSFFYCGGCIQLSLGDTLKMEYIHLMFSGALNYACVELPSSMPNLKIATIQSRSEMVNTPVLRSKFLHLKKLTISLSAPTFSPAYDYFSLVSLVGACPSLETLVLNVSQEKMEHVSIFTDPSDLRKMQGQQHHKMKRVTIQGFTSAKSLVELTCHFVESITSLEHLTLEAFQSSIRCSMPARKRRKCFPLPIDVLREAQRGLLAIRTYIEPKVPSMVKLRVIEPCCRCHAVVEL
ncbi:hypothetical protein BDA96_05G008300 [Sorghum bicolor]|uniref:F-box domain-containing protein n=3 Tax=Sorghum bicolor TaxID=4558 RepID=A0A921UEB7_SORBI|nr:F-box/LRR-repeat protein At3g59190 [Sorghum bicolor]EES07867.2 hypothetical protein SORBI_3005G009100 [Sorghum bicolor]KAG0528403.1 hypothetical protein BDA96_05G008300 [Sorghum bicolor]|eukprot:XP_002448879.2 F-box/LRR-repeat protein At3g59190 [Sorghum bicolor]